MRAPVRLLGAGLFLAAPLALLPLVAFVGACEDMNRPFGSPHSPGPRSPASDASDAGELDAAQPSPAPSITASPNDIQI